MVFKDEVPSSPAWSSTPWISKDGPWTSVSPVSTPEHRDYRCVPPCLVYVMLGMEPRASGMLGVHALPRWVFLHTPFEGEGEFK